ncbi:MAG: polyribonucleotide nucleotidyltransferase, partial [Spirochaetes bacterium]|nr:polyribonucleotide nucleotidyltransferase [Spirochaetota bacterium]
LGGLRLSKVENEFLVNPTYEQCEKQDFELVLAGNEKKIVMIESAANCIEDEEVIKGFEISYKYLGKIAEGIDELQKQYGKEKVEFIPPEENITLLERIEKPVKEGIEKYYQGMADKSIDRNQFGEIIIDPVLATFTVEELAEEYPEKDIKNAIDAIFKKTLRENILKNNRRIDGRPIDQIREIQIKTSLLPRVHGSSMFMRGETQVLNILTLAAPGNEQILESIEGESQKKYIHHYNAPPYSVGETGRYGGAGRREIGHGALAEKALLPVIPSADEQFPYVIHLVSEVMGQNGSSSMASTCASTLTLMDGGVPIKAPVAGISIGLMTGETDDEFVTLTDIVGQEDFSGDMDFKVAGTYDSITAIQMDTKIKGLTFEVVERSIHQAREARRKILDMIAQELPKPREHFSKYAPKIETISVDVDSIAKVIGSGGKVIKQLTADYGVDISIDDDGTTSISGEDQEAIEKVKTIINGIVSDPVIGEIYDAKVVKLFDFGAILQIFPGKEGLVHISRISKEHVKDVASVLAIGQDVKARLFEIDQQGRLNFTMVLDEEVKRPARSVETRKRFNDRDRNNRKRH